MTRRPLFAPMARIVLLFAGLGPLVGGALYIPLAAAFEPSSSGGVLAIFGLTTQLLGRAVGWIFIYAIGLGPAAATGFLYALWDAVAPERAPRALVAALIGGLISYGLLWRLASVSAGVVVRIDSSYPYSSTELSKTFQEVINAPLQHAFVASGAIAGLVCAFAANLIGLSMRLEFAPPAPAPPPREGA